MSEPPPLTRNSITSKCGVRQGGPPGAVQVFNYLCALREPGARARGALPCAWAALLGSCSPASGVCDNCAQAEA
eukprot:385389-Pleurochrysis_carterae.AAC.1